MLSLFVHFSSRRDEDLRINFKLDGKAFVFLVMDPRLKISSSRKDFASFLIYCLSYNVHQSFQLFRVFKINVFENVSIIVENSLENSSAENLSQILKKKLISFKVAPIHGLGNFGKKLQL
jgi:hypothetical protein